jgi:hypothetical protein
MYNYHLIGENMINSIQGISAAQQMATEASKKIASNSGNLIENIVDLKKSEISHSANAKALQSENDRIGTILNIKV